MVEFCKPRPVCIGVNFFLKLTQHIIIICYYKGLFFDLQGFQVVHIKHKKLYFRRKFCLENH